MSMTCTSAAAWNPARVIHLHGELMKVRSLTHPDRLFTLAPPRSRHHTTDAHWWRSGASAHSVLPGAGPNARKRAEAVEQADMLW